MLKDFDIWAETALAQEIPEEVVAFCFNIYENPDDKWAVELVGCACFDEEDTDWACDEVTTFDTREQPFAWQEADEWDAILNKVVEWVNHYLEHGASSGKLKEKQAVAVGFVDGDLEILYQK